MRRTFKKDLSFTRDQIKEFFVSAHDQDKLHNSDAVDDTVKSKGIDIYNDIEILSECVAKNAVGWKVDTSDKLVKKLVKGPLKVNYYFRKNEGKLTLNENFNIFEEYEIFNRNNLNFKKDIVYTLTFINTDNGNTVVDHNGEKIGEIKFVVKLQPNDRYFKDKISEDHYSKIKQLCIKEVPKSVQQFLKKFESLNLF